MQHIPYRQVKVPVNNSILTGTIFQIYCFALSGQAVIACNPNLHIWGVLYINIYIIYIPKIYDKVKKFCIFYWLSQADQWQSIKKYSSSVPTVPQYGWSYWQHSFTILSIPPKGWLAHTALLKQSQFIR